MEVFNNWPKLQMFHFQTSHRQKAQIIKRPRPMVEYNSRYFKRVKVRKVFNALRSNLSFEVACICQSICRGLQLAESRAGQIGMFYHIENVLPH